MTTPDKTPTLAPTYSARSDWAGDCLYPTDTGAVRLENCARDTPSRTAIVDGSDGARWSYAELTEMVRSLAGTLVELGVSAGDVVTMQLPNWWESVVVFHAVARVGAVLNPVVPIYRAHEMGFILGQAKPKVMFVPEMFRGFDHLGMAVDLVLQKPPVIVAVRSTGHLPAGVYAFNDLLSADHIHAEPALDATAIALLLYTSGTTADPKGVLHSHQTLGYEVQSLVDLFSLGPDDTVFMPSPVTHITGLLFGLLMPVVTGCAVVLQDVWEPERAVDLIEAEGCRFIMGATPFLHGIVEEYGRRGHSSALRVFLCGGADVPSALVRRASEVLGSHVARVYGSSEFPTVCCGRRTDSMDIRADTDGIPIGPIRARIQQPADGVGELVVDGPERFLGYLDESLNSEAFTSDGMFRTGDLASISDNGAVVIHGRLKDIILRGGENISVKEVEDLLHEHSAVADVAIVAMPDPVMGERACAFIVPVEGAEPTLRDLTDFLTAQRVATQKWPERMELTPELPVTASGKVQKHVLRGQLRTLDSNRNP